MTLRMMNQKEFLEQQETSQYHRNQQKRRFVIYIDRKFHDETECYSHMKHLEKLLASEGEISVLSLTANQETPMTNPRPLYAIAQDIQRHWSTMPYNAEPYWRAMRTLHSITDDYHSDSAKDVVLYFLSNASGWRGPMARRIKAELKEMLK